MAEFTVFQPDERPPRVPKPDHPVEPRILTVQEGVPILFPGCDGAAVRVVRDGTVIHETSIAQLKRFKDDAREVAEGFECGILLDGFNDLREGDVFEVYETRAIERTDLSDGPSPGGAG